MPVREAAHDPGLALQQPVQHAEHPVAGDRAEAERGPEARGRRRGRQRPGGGRLRGGFQDARRDGETARPLRPAAQDPHHAERPQRPQRRGDVAVGEGAADLEGGIGGRQHHAATEGVDEGGRHPGEVGERLPLDALSLAPRLAQQDGGRG